jgi:hypothetical protein
VHIQPPHSSWADCQAVSPHYIHDIKSVHFRKELIASVHARAEVPANENKKDFMINHNESYLNCSGIEPGPPDSQSNALTIELTGRHQTEVLLTRAI